MTDFCARLIHRFRKQQEFAEGYSPLYARLFGLVGDWLAAEKKVTTISGGIWPGIIHMGHMYSGSRASRTG